MPPQHKQHQKQHPRTDENSSPPLLGRHNQGVMVPGDATSASTRIKQQQQQQQQQQPSSDVAGDRTVEPLIVFDWDDTILTSSWIQVNELLQAGSYDELPLEVRRDLAQLERRCVFVFFLSIEIYDDLGVPRHQPGGSKICGLSSRESWRCAPSIGATAVLRSSHRDQGLASESAYAYVSLVVFAVRIEVSLRTIDEYRHFFSHQKSHFSASRA